MRDRGIDRICGRMQGEMNVAVKFVKPIQREHTTSMRVKPLHTVFKELQGELEALVLLPERHPNVAGLEAIVSKFPKEGDQNQTVKCHKNNGD